MLGEFNKLNPKPKNSSELKTVLQTIWDKLPDQTIRKAITGFRKWLNARVSAGGAHFEHSISELFYGQSFSVNISYEKLHIAQSVDVTFVFQSRTLFSCKIRSLSLTLCLFSVYKAIREEIYKIVDRRVLSQRVKFGEVILMHYWDIAFLWWGIF